MISAHTTFLIFNWWAKLRLWAAALVPLDVAEKLASQALSLVYLQACRGQETDDGPWVASCDALYELLCKNLALYDNANPLALLRDLPRPCDMEHYDMCKLYAAVYHVCYSAELSLHQREHMALLISNWTPAPMTQDELNSALTLISGEAHPLRRVVDAFTDHQHDDELICLASETLWRTEHQKSRRWLCEGSERKEVV